MTGSDANGGNPFVGPRPIQQGEALHGRGAEVRALYDRLRARRIVVLHSPSGAGKSSLIQAGLIPKLREGGFDVWRPIRVNIDPHELPGVRPGSANRYLLSALVSLEEGRPPEQRLGPGELAGMDLLAYLELRARPSGQAGRPVVLLFDQFEELLTVEPRAVDAKHEFFAALGRALETEHYWALFSLREDYLAAFAPYRDRVPTHLSHSFRLDLLGRDGAREAAVELARAGVPSRSFPAVDQLIRDLSMVRTQLPDGETVAEEGLHVEPVHLQVVGRQLWAKMPPDDLAIDAEDIQEYADVSSVLGGYYADAVGKVAAGDLAVERAVREWVRSKLVAGGTRSQVRRDATESAGLPNALVDRLVSSYLVRAEQRAGATWFELSHDRMVEPVERDNQAWEQSHLHSSQVQARLWEAGGRSRALLLRAEALPEAEASRRENEALWTKAEQDFLSESRQLRHEEARQRLVRRGAAVVLSVALVAAVGAGLMAYRQSIVATRGRQDALAAKALADEASAEAHDAKLASYQEHGRLAALAGAEGAALAYLSEVYSDGYRNPGRSVWTARFLLAGLARGMAFPVLRGVDAKVATMVFDADGMRVATAGASGPPQIWDARTGRLIATLEGHSKPVRGMAFSPKGETLATAGEDGSVRLFAAEDGRPLRTLEAGPEPLRALAFSPLDEVVAVGSATGAVRLLDSRDGRLLAQGKGLTLPVFALAFSSDGNTLAGAGQEGVVGLWSALGRKAGKAGKTIRFDTSRTPLPIRALAFSHDGKTLAAGGDDWNVHLITLADRSDRKLAEHTGTIRALAFSGDGNTLASAGDDGTARLWPREAGPDPDGIPERPQVPALSSRLEGHTGAVLAVAFVTDAETGARTVATAGADGTARLWVANRLRAELNDHSGPVRAVAFSPDGKTVATASEDGSARLFSPAGGRQGLELKGPGGKLTRVAFSPNGETVAAAGEGNSSVLVWRVGDGAPFARLDGHTQPIRAVTFAPDGKTIATASDDGSARLWRATGGPAVAVLDAHEGQLRAVAFSPDGATVATAGVDPRARLWPVKGGSGGGGASTVLEGHEDKILSVAFSPDGETVATASNDGTARLWRTAGGPARAVLAGHRGGVSMVTFSPGCGRTVATAGADGTSVLWAADDGHLLARLIGHTDAVNMVAFSPDGRLVATASLDRTARLWDAAGGTPLAVLAGHWSYVYALAFSPDSETLATASDDGTARLWDLRLEQRPAAEIARQMSCRIPWKVDGGALVPVRPDPARCDAPAAPEATASGQ